jgi:hypothetical protein
MMDNNDITELAKGMVPFVRECVAEAYSKVMVLPPELAGEVASAVRMLHESPALEPRSEPLRAAPKVTRIERDADGNFVPVYDDQPL